MKLFVANCTKQVRDFVYRMPEAGQRMQRIEIGQQIQIAGTRGGDLSQPDIDAIITQYARYGMKSVEEARKAKTFTGLCYSIDKPVKIENMEIVLQLNDQVLVQRGQNARKAAAIATAAQIEQGAGGENLKTLETSVQEFRKDGGEAEVQEGVRVDKTAGAPEEVVTGKEATARIKGKK